jgi:hypothetical protein
MTFGDEAQVRGHAYLSYVTPLKEHADVWQRVAPGMPADLRRFLDGELFANQWYPRAHLHGLLDAIERAYPGDLRIFRELGGWSARHQIGTVYRAFLAFASPAIVFRRAESVWSRQTTVGTFRVVEDADDHLIGELTDPGVPRRLPQIVGGWSDDVIRMLRRVPVPTSVSSPAPGRWRFVVRWHKG